MSFSDLLTNEEEQEYIEETILQTTETRKIWSKTILQKEIEAIESEITELQARKIELETQITKFTK